LIIVKYDTPFLIKYKIPKMRIFREPRLKNNEIGRQVANLDNVVREVEVGMSNEEFAEALQTVLSRVVDVISRIFDRGCGTDAFTELAKI